MDDHQFKEGEIGSVGELSTVCSQIVLKCLYLARVGRPDILWSVNKLARAVTKWTKYCDKRLARLISYIHNTSEYRQYCYVGNTIQQCRLGLFQDSDFAGDVEDSKSTSAWVLCIFGSHTFVPITWMCKKQSSVSHSSAEAEIISLDAGLRMDGIPALTLWEFVGWSISFRTERNRWTQRATRKLVGSCQAKHAQHPNQAHHRHSNKHWSHSIKYNEFWFQCYVVCFWGQSGGNQNDYRRSKSHNETCFTDPEICSGLVVWQD